MFFATIVTLSPKSSRRRATCVLRISPMFHSVARHFWDIDEARFRGSLYLHEGLDIDAANRFWSDVSGIPVAHFSKPYRAVPDVGIRHNKHEHGCFTARYHSTPIQRAIMGLSRALLSSQVDLPG